jgi:hypothetical protein
LKIISVVGTGTNGKQADLLEIGINRGRPWYAGPRGKLTGRRRVEKYTPTQEIQREIFGVLREITRYQLKDRKYLQSPSDRFPFSGIRIIVHPDDAWLIESLSWQEPLHNPNRRYYIRETVRFARRAFRGAQEPDKEALCPKHEWVLNRFRDNKILNNPYILYTVFQTLYAKESTSEWPAKPLYHLLVENDGITLEGFLNLVERYPQHAPPIDSHNLVVRLVGIRRRGELIFKVHPTHPMGDADDRQINMFDGEHDTDFNTRGDEHDIPYKNTTVKGVPF